MEPPFSIQLLNYPVFKNSLFIIPQQLYSNNVFKLFIFVL